MRNFPRALWKSVILTDPADSRPVCRLFIFKRINLAVTGRCNPSLSALPLTLSETKRRALALVVLPCALLALALIPPGSLPPWFPLHTSCGAITGLPCIFCGTTRAIHYLLHGDLHRALYYNWLAFPLVAGTLALILLQTTELLLRRNFTAGMPKLPLTKTSLGGFAISLVLLWFLQVYLAVSQHKAELLNPNGPLYSLVVR
jgi:hypothetical protein